MILTGFVNLRVSKYLLDFIIDVWSGCIGMLYLIVFMLASSSILFQPFLQLYEVYQA